jgi:hypothetical protein
MFRSRKGWVPSVQTLSVWKLIVAFSIAIILIVVGTPIFVAQWNIAMASTAGTGRSRALPSAIVAIVTYMPMLLVLLKLFPDIRTWNLKRRRPPSFITSVIRGRELQDASRYITILRQAPDYSPGFPLYMSLVANQTGLQLWGGVFRLQLRWTGDWEDVVEIGTTTVDSGSRDAWAVEITVKSDEGTVALPLMFTSPRLWGYARAKEYEVPQIVDCLERVRNEARTSGAIGGDSF